MKKTSIAAIAAACIAACHGETVRKKLIPEREWAMIRQVAVNYDLDENSTWLLAAIRRHENGRAGLEFGIGGPMDSGHPAHRFRDGTKSFYIQAMWAAGTIKKHYTGDVSRFAKRYNPAHPAKWADGVSAVLRRIKIENGHVLPGVRPRKRTLDF